MTFLQMKTSIDLLLKSRREVAMPQDDPMLSMLINNNLLNIANRYKVLTLVTKSENFRVLRDIGDGYYIRMPSVVRVDDDKIDVDSELLPALANFVASDLSSLAENRVFFKRNANKLVKDYSFKLYKTESKDVL